MTDKEFDLKLKAHLLEQAKHESELRHKWVQESHWTAQRIFWLVVGTAGITTAIITAIAAVFKVTL